MSDPWYILGAGAIGSLLACRLQKAGLDVHLLRRAGSELSAQSSLVLEEDHREQQLHFAQHPVAAIAPGGVKRLLICTKAYDVKPAFVDVLPGLAEDAVVLLLHNGMGTLAEIQPLAPQLQIAAGTTTEGAYWKSPGILAGSGRGETRIGLPGSPEIVAGFTPLLETDTGFLWEADIEQSLWRKLLINCAINPLTALHGCVNGELLHNPELAAELHALCSELTPVAQALGYQQLASRLEQEVRSVAKATGHNRSSMLQDHQAGRPTEIDYITGYLLQQVHRLGLDCPINERLLAELKPLTGGEAN